MIKSKHKNLKRADAFRLRKAIHGCTKMLEIKESHTDCHTNTRHDQCRAIFKYKKTFSLIIDLVKRLKYNVTFFILTRNQIPSRRLNHET